MALEFALAVVTGLIIALISSVIQSRSRPSGAVLDISERSIVSIRSATVVDVNSITETEEITLIQESTFRISSEPLAPDRRVPALAGLLLFGITLAVLLLV